MKKSIFLLVLLSSIFLTFILADAQESPGYSYEEYSYYTKAQKEKDLDKKDAALFEFMEKYPDSKLMPYIMAEFQKYFTARIQNKQFDKAIADAKKLLSIRKDEPVAINTLAAAYYQKKDYSEYLQYAEMIYAKNPTPQLAYYMADAALNIGDIAKAEKYTSAVERTGTLVMKVDLNYKLYLYYRRNKNDNKTLEQAQTLANLLRGATRPADFKGDWDKYRTSILLPVLGTLGTHYMQVKDFNQAIPTFQQLLSMNNKDAVSHFYLGLAYWFNKQATKAAPEFAKAIVLNVDPISQRAEDQLRKLLKAVNQGDKEYQKFLSDARTELGLS